MSAKKLEQIEIEAPYELPEGWKWCRLGDVADCLDSFRKPINSTERANRTGRIPYYGATGQVGWIDDFLTDEELVLLGEDGAPFLDLIKDKAYIIAGKAWVNNHAHILRSKYGATGNKYLLNYLNNFNYTEYVNGTTRLKLTQSAMLSIPFPLPPTLAEQKRIVSRIETLFAKLDEAEEKTRAVLDGFETRKAAILHKAFTGELTANWRKANGVSDDSREEKRFDSCIAKMQNGLSKRSGTDGEETVVLRLANIGENDFDVSDLRTIKLTPKELENYSLTKNDVVMIRVNGSKTNVGRQILVKNDDGWSFCDHIIRITFESFCLPNYMVYFSNTKEYKDYVEDNMVSSAGQNTISRKGLSNLTLTLPSLPEQQEIVRILDTVLDKESRAKEAAQTVLDQIALLKKSILARAFRGKI